jgi:hypothetical protein
MLLGLLAVKYGSEASERNLHATKSNVVILGGAKIISSFDKDVTIHMCSDMPYEVSVNRWNRFSLCSIMRQAHFVKSLRIAFVYCCMRASSERDGEMDSSIAEAFFDRSGLPLTFNPLELSNEHAGIQCGAITSSNERRVPKRKSVWRIRRRSYAAISSSVPSGP